MQVLLAIAVVGGGIILISPIQLGLAVYFASLLWIPPYLTVKLGTLDFSISRILILVLLAKLLTNKRVVQRFHFCAVDYAVLIYFTLQIIAGTFTSPDLGAFYVNRSGNFVDTGLIYFVIRLFLTSRDCTKKFLVQMMIIACPLAMIGLYQCMTGYNPFAFLYKYSAANFGWFMGHEQAVMRRGNLFRADVTFSVPIMYGLFLALMIPICFGALYWIARRYRPVYLVGLGVLAMGVFSSLSSGPLMSVMLASFFFFIYPFRRYWKILLGAVVVFCVLIEIVSNRHFYDVFSRFTFSLSTAWYRSRLIQVALFEGGMSGHWIAGYGMGGEAPNWGERIDGNSLDIVNHYILILFRYGLLGLAPFFYLLGSVIRELVKAFKNAAFDMRWYIWGLSAVMFGLMATMMTVSVFGQTVAMMFLFFGLCVNSKYLVPSMKARPRVISRVHIKNDSSNIGKSQIKS